ncbi:MAG: helix-turn-helix domain-containing protein [Desulfobulbaceae bacterium]|nr:helix-turn-helix domain-containing protein [Desulfobulbaceae bacterium]
MEMVAMNVENPFIPHEVVELVIRQDLPLVRAWRHYMGMTVEELARISGLKTYEVEQLEAGDNAFSYQLEKVAAGLQLDIDQLVDL